MDSKRFDGMAKSLAIGKSRRSVIGGLFGGALAITGLSRASAAPASKVDICHYDADNDVFFRINVSSNSLSGHLGHGDFKASDLWCDTDQQIAEGGCSCECINPVDSCPRYTQLSESGCSCTCPVLTSEEPRCYWMETSSGSSCWTTDYADGLTEAQCSARNAGCGLGGACYGWGTTTEGLSS